MELAIDRLTKQYQNKIAVDRISLRLNTGILVYWVRMVQEKQLL